MTAPRREEGAVLLVVLVALALLAALSGVALRLGTSGLQGLRAERVQLATEVLAPSALAVLGAQLARPETVERDGSSLVMTLPGGARVEARVQAAEGLLNPLFARLPLIQALLKARGASPEQALRLTRAIGAARAEGQIAGRADLAALFAAEPALWRDVSPYLTFLGRRTTVDMSTAPPELRFAVAGAAMAAVDLSQTLGVRGYYEIDLRSLAEGERPEAAAGRFMRFAVLRDRSGRMHVISVTWPQEMPG